MDTLHIVDGAMRREVIDDEHGVLREESEALQGIPGTAPRTWEVACVEPRPEVALG